MWLQTLSIHQYAAERAEVSKKGVADWRVWGNMQWHTQEKWEQWFNEYFVHLNKCIDSGEKYFEKAWKMCVYNKTYGTTFVHYNMQWLRGEERKIITIKDAIT